ncbi:hypothetical protein M3Y97_00284200 [Aphelenchoides bicaudatus]|nr:hypothetical protein M3Y97_00284200 [Aphelenchoides bicaudatus]
MADSYKLDDDGANRLQEALFFNGKLRLVAKDCFELDNDEDVLVIPCHPDILSGGNVFNTVYEKLGDTLTTTLQPYLCLEPGSCKMMQAGELNNYKRLAMCVLPELFMDEGLTRIDRFKVSMCIADALDLAAESSFENVVFTHWPIASFELSAEILLLCLSHWIRYSVYFDKVKRITVALESEDLFSVYYELAKLIEEDPSLVLDVLQERRPEEYGNEQFMDQEVTELVPIDFAEAKGGFQPGTSHSTNDRQVNQNGSAPFLFYSRNLSTSILSVEQADSSIRQYRLSTTVAEKNTHYFRCSRCDYLSRSEELGQFRPKITVRNASIISTRFPEHHPMCRSTSKEKFVIQQLDRLWKAVAIYETEELRNCYIALRSIAQREADALYLEMEQSTGRFPEWELMKQMAEKYHNQYPIRLIKCSNTLPPVSGVNMAQYSEIRRVEDEIDGVVKETPYAWITEGIELDRDDGEEELEMEVSRPTENSSIATPEPSSDFNETAQSDKPSSTRPHRIIRPTYKIQSSQGTSTPASTSSTTPNSVRFRIVRPPKSSSPTKRSHE